MGEAKLSPRYEIRPLTLEHLDWAKAVLAHSFVCNALHCQNLIEIQEKSPRGSYDLILTILAILSLPISSPRAVITSFLYTQGLTYINRSSAHLYIAPSTLTIEQLGSTGCTTQATT